MEKRKSIWSNKDNEVTEPVHRSLSCNGEPGEENSDRWLPGSFHHCAALPGWYPHCGVLAECRWENFV